MLVEDAQLSADELAHLKVVAPSLLAGQRWGFWLLANAVALAWIAALLVVAAPNPEGFRRELVLPLLVAWLGLNGFFFWRRHVSRGLRGDVAAPRKQIIRGDAGGLVASDNALTYTVGGEGWRVYPALPLGSGFVVGRLRIETVAGVGGTAVTLQRTSQGDTPRCRPSSRPTPPTPRARNMPVRCARRVSRRCSAALRPASWRKVAASSQAG